MELPLLFHPFEAHRRWRLFWKEIANDLDLRFPETRRRLALEMKQRLAERDQQSYNNVIKRFQSARRVVSAFDWPLLVEWTERKEQALSLALIEESLGTYTQGSEENANVFQSIRGRLEEIGESIRANQLARDPSLWRCLKVRWQLLPLRDEVEYLSQRLSKVSTQQAA